METVKEFKLSRPFDECAKFALRYSAILRLISVKSNNEIEFVGYNSSLLLYYSLVIFVPCTLQVIQISLNIIQSVNVPVSIYKLYRISSLSKHQLLTIFALIL